MGRTEFGVEIHVALAHLVYATGLSIEKACDVLGFFQELALSRSQANSLLNRLAKHWEQEFDHLCDILAHSAVVHTDETSWSLNSVWVFIGEKVQLLFHGVHKDAATLEAILHLDAFPGVIVSVLLSLGKQLGSLRLRAIVDEVNRWVAHGKSCFEELVEQSEIEPRGLDVVCPKPG